MLNFLNFTDDEKAVDAHDCGVGFYIFFDYFN